MAPRWKNKHITIDIFDSHFIWAEVAKPKARGAQQHITFYMVPTRSSFSSINTVHVVIRGRTIQTCCGRRPAGPGKRRVLARWDSEQSLFLGFEAETNWTRWLVRNGVWRDNGVVDRDGAGETDSKRLQLWLEDPGVDHCLCSCSDPLFKPEPGEGEAAERPGKMPGLWGRAVIRGRRHGDWTGVVGGQGVDVPKGPLDNACGACLLLKEYWGTSLKPPLGNVCFWRLWLSLYMWLERLLKPPFGNFWIWLPLVEPRLCRESALNPPPVNVWAVVELRGRNILCEDVGVNVAKGGDGALDLTDCPIWQSTSSRSAKSISQSSKSSWAALGFGGPVVLATLCCAGKLGCALFSVEKEHCLRLIATVCPAAICVLLLDVVPLHRAAGLSPVSSRQFFSGSLWVTEEGRRNEDDTAAATSTGLEDEEQAPQSVPSRSLEINTCVMNKNRGATEGGSLNYSLKTISWSQVCRDSPHQSPPQYWTSYVICKSVKVVTTNVKRSLKHVLRL